MLTADQVEEYALPRIPIKESEKRAAAFEKQFGRGAVELDALEALHPGALATVVSQALQPYYSHSSALDVDRKRGLLRQAIHRKVAAVTARYSAEIKALQAMCEELQAIQIQGDFEPQRAEPDTDDAQFDWLFDSDRSYLEQIRAYKRGGRPGA